MPHLNAALPAHPLITQASATNTSAVPAYCQGLMTSPSTSIGAEFAIRPLLENFPNYRPPGINSFAIVWRSQMLPGSRLKRSCQCCLTL